MNASAIKTDYLVVGAGAAGMAITDELLTYSNASITVIVIIDSDDAAKGIWSLVQSITKQKPVASDPYTHVRGNLYVVPIPLPSGQSSAAIESSFDAAAFAIKVDGKTFSSDKSFDEKLYFGKMVFAHRVVKPNADTINFKGFTQLLTNISKAIADHKKRYPPTP